MSGTVAGLYLSPWAGDTGHWCSVSHEADLLRSRHFLTSVALKLGLCPLGRDLGHVSVLGERRHPSLCVKRRALRVSQSLF